MDELLNLLRQRDFRALLPCYLRSLHLYRERGRFVSIVCIVAKTFSRPIQRNFRLSLSSRIFLERKKDIGKYYDTIYYFTSVRDTLGKQSKYDSNPYILLLIFIIIYYNSLLIVSLDRKKIGR